MDIGLDILKLCIEDSQEILVLFFHALAQIGLEFIRLEIEHFLVA